MNVGYFCTYVPEEIIQSCNAIPVFLYPESPSTNHAIPYLPTPFCPFSKILLNYFLTEKNQDLDFIIFGGGCDAGKKIYDVFIALQTKIPCYYLHIPLVNNQESLKFYHHSLNDLSHKLLSLQGLSQQNFTENLRIVLDHSFILKQTRSQAFLKGELSGHSLIQGKTQSQSSLDSTSSSKVSILLLASHLFVENIIQLLEEKEFRVFDGSAIGMRRYVFPEIEYSHQSDALETLSRWYLINKVPCPGYNPQKRLETLQKFINRVGLQGIVYFYPKFCDQSLYDLSFLKKHIKIPLLPLEHDMSYSSLGQWETRIDAFREVLSNQ